ncbi:transcriptional regulator [Paenibacillus sp. J31TS4]|uniref:helix-turn-helix domain-containing protein n=1 Tax=Paenibacillus sp. J31TS4 TaxID=2807195 RepID=UPI001B11F092|nr:helix-turn-helix domain-containing protein [Paenibacillus sp. J31TS4]GIP40331.1 transcriptional regulator [Paenibacillus sp. J31TS4]
MIGNRIHLLRKEKGFTLTELAEQAQVAKSYLSNVERGVQSNPSIQFVEKIAAALQVPLDAILTGTAAEEELDPEWQELVHEAMASGISKEQFREFLAFNKWRLDQTKETGD